jgi:adenylate cyclase
MSRIHQVSGRFDSASLYLESGKAEAIKANYKNGIYLAYASEASAFMEKNQYKEALNSQLKALDLLQEMKQDRTMVGDYLNLGGIYSKMHMLDKAITVLNKALDEARKLKWTDMEYMIMSNLASTYQMSGDNRKAVRLNEALLKRMEDTKIMDPMAYSAALHNLGMAQELLGETASAAKNYLLAYKFNKENGNPFHFLQNNLTALGLIFLNDTLNTLGKQIGDNRRSLDISMSYLKELENMAMAQKDTGSLMYCYSNLSRVYLARGEKQTALRLALKGLEWCKKYGDVEIHEEYFGTVAKIQFALGNFREAAIFYRDQKAFGDSLKKVETAEKVALLSNTLEIEHMNEQLQTKETQLKESRYTTYLLVAVSAFILVLALIVFYFLRQKQKAAEVLEQQNREINKERDRSENLLLNILPSEVAEELKATGKAEARDFDQVSILFSDFKEFTRVSEKLSAKELVAEINYCYEAFDEIMSRYGIEKIKTIGDSYMAAGGLPVPEAESVRNTVKAALDMQRFIEQRKNEREELKEISFEMRLGIHTGPVVAGIVGVKKFQYDVWGDTVNTASRMESSGEEGKVNISQTTWELIKDDPDFSFEYRGKITAKNKGEIDMYFVASRQV